MKYSRLRSQIAALRAQLPQRGLTICIEGGVPDAIAAPESAEPVQLELPLKAPPGLPRGAGRVFVKPGPTPKPLQGPSLPDPAPENVPDWERQWWQNQNRRRDRG